ncbi:MAG: two-component system response regulator PhoP [Enterobacteriaceae bacterium]|jgi:two-component system response regulator PhoP|nr:two-component system response regulator PhoP [Enterobacteriaceae bacterium]
MRILFVEDNELLRHHLSVQFRELGHQVDAAGNTKEADYYLRENKPDVAIIDLGLPGEDGLSLLKRWRSNNIKIPILILSVRASWQEKVDVLNAGADDYVVKHPDQLEEVHARIQALMRRNSGLASQVAELPPFSIDLSRKEFSINKKKIKLTYFEYKIIETLIRNNGKVVSKESLMRQLYSDSELRESHTIDVLMGRLRKKILAEWQPEVIVTVRGQGYCFDVKSNNA